MGHVGAEAAAGRTFRVLPRATPRTVARAADTAPHGAAGQD
ncbi:hypothetical protein AB0M61_30885 [Streptomyces sp. NPDC051642]